MVSARVLTGRDFQRMALAAAASIDSEHDTLSRLDAAGGDGDHGANIRSGMTQARDLVSRLAEPSPASVFGALVEAVQEHMGGAGGVLMGEFFAGIEDSFGPDEEVDGKAIATGLANGLERMVKVGKANVGDRTMVDALAPAVAAASEAASRSGAPMEVLAKAALAAREGAEATKDLTPRLGRATYAPEHAVGTPDPGAVSAALIFEAWARAVNEEDAE